MDSGHGEGISDRTRVEEGEEGMGRLKRVENMFLTLVEGRDNPGSRVVVRKGKMRVCKKRGIFEAF
jgi:hypothetical protein